MPAPITYTWTDDGVMKPLPRFAAICDKQFVIGELYRLEVWEDRSDATHKHEFAFLREAWKQLPEELAIDYPTPEHLRKRALIQAGYYEEQIVDAGSKAAALRIAAFIRPMDDFALVFVRDSYVVKRTAKSQSRRAMKRQEFQASKEAILQIVSEMIGVDPATLQANAEQAA